MASDESVHTMRHVQVPRRMVQTARAVVDREPEIRSVMASFWEEADEFGRIFAELCGSTQRAIANAVEHDCGDAGTDRCWSCSTGLSSAMWTVDAETERALGAFFPLEPMEWGEMPFASVSRPFERADVSFLGQLMSPRLDRADTEGSPVSWSDTELRLLEAAGDPWPVLADLWLDRSDPRGELAVLLGDGSEEARAEAFAIWLQHHRDWVGRLGPFLPRAGVPFAADWLRSLQVYVPPGEVDAFDAADPVLLGVRRLRFAAGSAAVVGPGMRAVEWMGPLDDAALLALSVSPGPWRIERLEVVLEHLATLFGVDWRKLPALRHLQVRCAELPPVDLRSLPLPDLDVLEVVPDLSGLGAVHRREAGMEDWLGAVVPTSVDTLRITSFHHGLAEPAGWSVSRTADKRLVVRRSGFVGKLYELGMLLANRPRYPIEVRGGPTWDPTDAERAEIEAW